MEAHEVDHPGLVQAELRFNGFKSSAVFPSHLDNARDVGFSKFLHNSLSTAYHDAAKLLFASDSGGNPAGRHIFSPSHT